MRRSSLLAAFTVFTLYAAPVSDDDRARVLREMDASRKQFLDSIANLSDAQWKYKAGPDRWSIQETAEHIVKADGFLLQAVSRQVMASPADPAKAESRKAGNAQMDDRVVAMLRDRSHKAQAPEPIQPHDLYATPEEAAEAFETARAKTVEYVKTTNDNLRDHFFEPVPGFSIDGVQGLLFLAGHTERHVEQIEEVKQSAGYPGK